MIYVPRSSRATLLRPEGQNIPLSRIKELSAKLKDAFNLYYRDCDLGAINTDMEAWKDMREFRFCNQIIPFTMDTILISVGKVDNEDYRRCSTSCFLVGRDSAKDALEAVKNAVADFGRYSGFYGDCIGIDSNMLMRSYLVEADIKVLREYLNDGNGTNLQKEVFYSPDIDDNRKRRRKSWFPSRFRFYPEYIGIDSAMVSFGYYDSDDYRKCRTYKLLVDDGRLEDAYAIGMECLCEYGDDRDELCDKLRHRIMAAGIPVFQEYLCDGSQMEVFVE